MSSPYDGIDRSTAPSLLGQISVEPPTVELLQRAVQAMLDSGPSRPAYLLPAGLYDVVKRYGWGREALDWIEKHRMK